METKGKQLFSKYVKKRVPIGPFKPTRWMENNFLFKDGLISISSTGFTRRSSSILYSLILLFFPFVRPYKSLNLGHF